MNGIGVEASVILMCAGITAETVSLSLLWLRLIEKYGGDPRLRLDTRLYLILLAGSTTAGVGIGLAWQARGAAVQLAAGVLSAYLLCASITDARTCEVYTFLHIPGAAAGVFLLFRENALAPAFVPLTVFALLQRFLFTRMYGKADGKVFWVCALYQAAFGAALVQFLLHMAAAFTCLAAVQAIRGNIDTRGNLKRKVPFVPYIAATGWLLLCMV